MNMEILSLASITSCFVLNPLNEEWTNPQCYGNIPEPRDRHATTKGQDKIWLYGGSNITTVFHDLFELDMHSCTWTLIKTPLMQPQACIYCTLSMISDDKLVLHGGFKTKALSDTWILDLPTKTWRQYTSDTTRSVSRSHHTGSKGINNNVVIIGGCLLNSKRDQNQCTIFHVSMEPKRLLQLAMQMIYKHHTSLPWNCLPRSLIMLLDIYEIEDPGEVYDFTTL